MVVVNTTTLPQALDLTTNELKVFEGFVKNPGVTAAKLSGILRMDKSSTYRSVNKLVAENLLIPVPHHDAMTYIAVSPDELKSRYSEKLSSLANIVPALTTFVSSLNSAARRKTTIRTETGIEAVRKALSESLGCKEKLIRELFRTHSFFKQNPEHVGFVLDTLRTRVKNKIAIRQFYATDPTQEHPDIQKIMKNDKRLLKTVRHLPPGLDDMNSMRIWDDTTNIFSEDEEGVTLVITITDKYVTSFMKKIYDFIWNLSKA